MTTLDQPLDIKAFEDLLRQAISAAKAEGIVVCPESFGVGWDDEHDRWVEKPCEEAPPGVCPLGAVVLFRQPAACNRDLDVAIELATGLTRRQSDEFWSGFDGYLDNAEAEEPAYYQLGLQFRAEYDQGLLT